MVVTSPPRGVAGGELLAGYAVPIASGTTPAPAGSGRLSKERARRLAGELRGLEAARQRAAVAARSYVVVSPPL